MTKATIKFSVFLLIIGACTYLGLTVGLDIDYFRSLILRFPLVLSGIVFVLLYVGTTTFLWLGPKDVLRIAAALMFGAYVSTVFLTIAELCNLVILFYMSRRLGREFIQERFKIRPDNLDRVKDTISFVEVSALRINPFVPFRLMDLGFGLSRITLKRYLLVSFAVSPLRILWLQYILAGIGEGLSGGLSAVVQYALQDPVVLRYSSLYFLLVVVLSIIAVIVVFRRRRKPCKSK